MWGETGDGFFVQSDVTLIDVGESRNGLEKRTLAGTVRADDYGDFTRFRL